MTRLLIRGGRILDPASGRDESADLLVEEGRIAAVGRGLDARGAELLDAEGAWHMWLERELSGAGMVEEMKKLYCSSNVRHATSSCDWSSGVCSSDLRPMWDEGTSSVMDLLPVGILVLDESGRVLQANEAGLAHLGLDERVVGRDEIGRAACRERV